MAAHLPRRVFAAPFVLTLASACSPEPAHPVSSDASWFVSKSGDTCQAESNVDIQCPKGASCNPPPPRTYECPAAITKYPAKVVRHGQATECKVEVTTQDGTIREDPVPCP